MDLEIVRIYAQMLEYSSSFTFCVYGSGDYNNYSITDHRLFEYLKVNFIEYFNKSHAISFRHLLLNTGLDLLSSVVNTIQSSI